MAKQQHDERHNEGDGDGVGQRQIAEREEHHAERDDVKRGSYRGQPVDSAAERQRSRSQDHDRRQDQKLNAEADENELSDAGRLAENLGDRVAQGRDHAKPKHQCNTQNGPVGCLHAAHGATLGEDAWRRDPKPAPFWP